MRRLRPLQESAIRGAVVAVAAKDEPRMAPLASDVTGALKVQGQSMATWSLTERGRSGKGKQAVSSSALTRLLQCERS